VHAQSEEKVGDSKDSFYEELEQVSEHFPKCHMNILIGEFNQKEGKEDIFEPTIGNESTHQDRNKNGVRMVNFATSKNLVLKGTVFPHRNFHKYTWIYPDGKAHNQINNILIDRRWHLSILNVRNFMAANCGTDHHMVVTKVREALAVSKKAAQNFHRERLHQEAN
jgi:hypothetical protein